MYFAPPVFEPHPLLKNRHAMTIAGAFVPRRFSLPAPEARLFEVEPATKILGHCNWQEGRRKDAPVLVLVHGLEGSSDSNYMKGIAQKTWRCGFHVIRLNQRNCGGTELLTPTLYNSGLSRDFRAVFEELAGRDGFERIFFAAYSMGGNLMMKMAGEFGNAVPPQLRGVCVVCPSLDLAACANALEKKENFAYQKHFVSSLMSHYARKAQLFPQGYSRNGFGKLRTVREFDDVITAPHFGFRNAQDYYEKASAKCVVHAIRVPLLLITAQDDPFVPFETIVAAGVERNSAIRLLAPRHGGHCGFISKHSGDERFWAEARIVEFCAALSKDARGPL